MAGNLERSSPGPLGELVDLLDGGEAGRSSSYPELPALGEFQKIWSRIRTESQLRQSLEQTTENAGPLNSSALVHRSMALMRDVSPGYLRHFLSYIDDLSWMERLGDGKASPAGDAPAAASIGKRRKTRPRTRRE
ncbi:DUF2894 domain-containing protein [Luteibacter yeojuensis]|uniref:DUF2894 domain-containing protein n=1 Tax=Luteibacter yeojuensis TaxID=345309 RepID=A0A7X5QVX4_9GAMM|nr:DUF2894 domain-containing protein [Luteibacter yeojuensis]NID16363.1 DUF2894 domain-containing protein [Luteibacter yeojuensis]